MPLTRPPGLFLLAMQPQQRTNQFYAQSMEYFLWGAPNTPTFAPCNLHPVQLPKRWVCRGPRVAQYSGHARCPRPAQDRIPATPPAVPCRNGASVCHPRHVARVGSKRLRGRAETSVGLRLSDAHEATTLRGRRYSFTLFELSTITISHFQSDGRTIRSMGA